MIAYIRRIENEKTDAKFARFDDVRPVFYHEIQWRDGIPTHNGDSLLDIAVFYFRAVGNAIGIAQHLVNVAIEHDIKVVDTYLRDGVGRRFKDMMADTLAEAGVPHPRTVSLDNIDSVDRVIEQNDFTYPCVLKFAKGGRRGIGTFLLRDSDSIDSVRQELRRRYENSEKGHANMGYWPFILQEHIPNTGDYRAIVVGGECIGVVKRGRKALDELVMNSSDHGARRYKRDRWPRSVGELAVRASEVMGVDVAGVDIVRHDHTRELSVIEVNEAPAFHVFERRTGIDVAGRIVSWLRTLT